jgi:hypothetical protein
MTIISASEVRWLKSRLNLVFAEGTLYLTTYQTGIPRMENRPLVIKLSVMEMVKGKPY